MDISEILALLESENTQQQIARDNPWIGALSIPQAIQIQPGKYSAGEEIVGSLVKGLLTGAGTSMAEDYQEKLQDEYGQALFSGLLGVEAKPNRLRKSIFKDASNLGSIFRVQQAEDAAKKRQALEDNYLLKKEGKIAEIMGENEAYELIDQMISGREEAPIVTDEGQGATEYQTPAGSFEASAKKAPSTASLLSPRGKEQYKREQDAFKQDQEIEGAYETFSKGVRQADEFANYRERVEAVQSLAEAFSDPSKASDFEFVFGIMKILDPRSVVRGDEQESVRRVAPLLGQLTSKVEGILSGTKELDDDTRKSLLRLAGRKLNASKSTYLSFKNERLKTAKRRGFEGAEDLLSLPELSADDLFKQFSINTSPKKAGSVGASSVAGSGLARLRQIEQAIQSGDLDAQELSALQNEAIKIAKGLE